MIPKHTFLWRAAVRLIKPPSTIWKLCVAFSKSSNPCSSAFVKTCAYSLQWRPRRTKTDQLWHQPQKRNPSSMPSEFRAPHHTFSCEELEKSHLFNRLWSCKRTMMDINYQGNFAEVKTNDKPVASLAMETFTEYEIVPSSHILLKISNLFLTSSMGLGLNRKTTSMFSVLHSTRFTTLRVAQWVQWTGVWNLTHTPNSGSQSCKTFRRVEET